jgi:glycerophosphoryl diester phosphodiesterase
MWLNLTKASADDSNFCYNNWTMLKGLFLILLMFSFDNQAQPLFIAHAGGGIDGQNYSNSLEALEHSYNNGFRYFEIDFSWTSDKQLVCLHDWEKRFKKVFGFKTKQPLTYQQFQQLVMDTKGLHPCTPESLNQWLTKHPDATIITDIKYNNIAAFKYLQSQYPGLSKHLLPQFYQVDEYQQLRQMGFKQLIWILYQYEGSLESVRNHASAMELLAVSMRAKQVRKKPMQQLRQDGQTLFVYTINSSHKLRKLHSKYGVTGFYTDFLTVQLNPDHDHK